MKKGLFFVVSFLLVSVGLYGAHNITNVDVIDQLGPESIPELIEVIRDPDPENDEVRVRALQKLSELKAKEAVDMLIEIMETRRLVAGGKEVYNWKLKVMAAKALAATDDERAAFHLAIMLRKDRDIVVKRAAAQALGLLGERARTKNTLDIMHAELEAARDNGLANDLSEALGKIGDKSSFGYLLKVTQGKYLNYVKETAQKAIANIKWNVPSVYETESSSSSAPAKK
ncbi:MAG: HEAT repeat domain-containing protein [Brevinematia bacterium]